MLSTQAWEQFQLASNTTGLGAIEPFVFDYIDITRQAMSYVFETLYNQYVIAYSLNDTVQLPRLSKEMVGIIKQLDTVMATHPLWMVGNLTTSARAWGNDTTGVAYDTSLRHLLSVWGPAGQFSGWVETLRIVSFSPYVCF